MAADSNSTPELRELLEVSRDLTNWYELGVQLRVEEHVLKDIEYCYSRDGISRCKTEVLSRWLRSDVTASWEIYVHALRATGHGEMAGRVIDKYCPKIPRELESDKKRFIDKERLDTKPTMSELLCLSYGDTSGHTHRLHIIDEIGSNWERLAFALRFPDTMVSTVRKDYRDNCKDCCRDTLSRWLRGMNTSQDPRPLTWRTLVSALHDARCSELARNIETSL